MKSLFEFFAVVSFIINIFIVGAAGYWFVKYKHMVASTSPSTPGGAIVLEVIDINDGGYRNRYVVAEYKGMKIVTQDYSAFMPGGKTLKVGDSVKIQEMKVDPGSGMKIVQYMITP